MPVPVPEVRRSHAFQGSGAAPGRPPLREHGDATATRARAVPVRPVAEIGEADTLAGGGEMHAPPCSALAAHGLPHAGVDGDTSKRETIVFPRPGSRTAVIVSPISNLQLRCKD